MARGRGRRTRWTEEADEEPREEEASQYAAIEPEDGAIESVERGAAAPTTTTTKKKRSGGKQNKHGFWDKLKKGEK